MTELHEPTPINFGQAGCPAMVRWHVDQWASCPAEPTHAGYVRPKQFHILATPAPDEDAYATAAGIAVSLVDGCWE